MKLLDMVYAAKMTDLSSSVQTSTRIFPSRRASRCSACKKANKAPIMPACLHMIEQQAELT